MLAHHPKTGAPIKIMNLDTSAWRDQKTLVWLDDVPSAAADPTINAIAWNRWEVGATSIAAATKLAAAGIRPDIVLCIDPLEEAHSWIRAGNWSTVSMIVVPRALATHIGLESLQRYKVTNMLCLEELTDVYPYTGPVWDGTLDDAKVLVPLTLRLGRTFPVAAEALSPSRRETVARFGLAVESALRAPPPLWLVTQYYEPVKAKRRREIRACLEANLANPLVDRVVLLNETACAPQHEKITETVIGSRLTYADVLRWVAAKDFAPGQEDAIIVFANADIFLDSASFRLLWSVNMADPARFFALLRWEVAGTDAASVSAAQLFGPRGDSQDTWVVSAAAVKRLLPAADAGPAAWTPFEIPFGKAGCDNAITVEMLRKKFQVVNPALNLRTFHFHASQERSYDPADIVDRPMYFHIQPTGLQDMRARIAFDTKPTQFAGQALTRPIRGPLTAAQKATFCTMVARASRGAIALSPDDENFWVPPVTPLYRVEDAFQSREGLVFDYNSIFVGRSKAAAEAWTKATISSVAAAVRSKAAVAAPLSDEVAADPGRYILQYLAKVLVARKLLGLPDAEFWGSGKGGAADALRFFQWPSREVPVLSRDETAQAWCDELGLWLPQDSPAELTTREEVEALRGAFGLGGGWEAAASAEGPKKIVVVVDEKWLTQDVAEELEASASLNAAHVQFKFVWAGRTNLEATLRSFKGAWGALLFSTCGLGSWSWVLPKGARVWEVQSEMEPSAALLHLAAAAGLEHRLCFVSKGAPTAAGLKDLAAKLAGSLKEELATSPVEDTSDALPTLVLPAQPAGSFFGHAGDSFREMARLWAAAGHCRIREDPAATQVWFHDKGRVLLYDRPTLEWLAAAPAGEATWEVALFGNAAPPVGAPDSARWFFWPRRPELVEELVAAGAPDARYEARAQSLVFYGRSENAVQRGRRSKADWSTACSEFIHIDGEKPYPFTQREYLERLATARFGLCLAGYGLKCHREVECMAMGCVPIVAPEVDMDGYANPPKEGIHYFRAATPADAKRIATTTAPESWAEMSAAARTWWKANASVTGSWQLTQSLVEKAGMRQHIA